MGATVAVADRLARSQCVLLAGVSAPIGRGGACIAELTCGVM